ncbi:unnamed protein product [Cylicocyclus nassatus]|uniref:Uncharacterized protein n=1 Tax=Cylicocyclus nassatus TaxID=53992 RepID=A0AA36GRV0_CYLNA|nr:unnamed protein product [Cylicocyclus nassatus]
MCDNLYVDDCEFLWEEYRTSYDMSMYLQENLHLNYSCCLGFLALEYSDSGKLESFSREINQRILVPYVKTFPTQPGQLTILYDLYNFIENMSVTDMGCGYREITNDVEVACMFLGSELY